MNQLFKYVLENYLDNSQVSSKDKGYYKIMINQLPEYISNLLSNKYKVKGSCGMGNKAEIPWIGIFNTDITDKAQYGIYIDYLFRADMKGFYLCLDQGKTNFERFEKSKDEMMHRVASYFKDRIDCEFSKEPIKLYSKSQTGKDYEKVNILNKYYDIDHINDYNFEEDLKEMLKIYEDLVQEMEQQTYDEIITNLISNTDPNYLFAKEAQEQLEQELFQEAGTDNDEIITLTRVDIPVGKKVKKYTETTRRTPKKVNYPEKVKKNAENGLMGENLVIAYEKEKLRNAGREDLIDKIKWISKEDDGVGYDIQSFDESGNEIFIEVKTTEKNDDTVFFISANEVNKMEEKKEKYYIYRVYNIKTQHPELYVINYNEFNTKFKKDIMDYKVSLKA